MPTAVLPPEAPEQSVTPSTVPAPVQAVPSPRQSRLQDLLSSSAVTPDVSKTVQQFFQSKGQDPDSVAAFLRPLSIPQQAKEDLARAYYAYEPPPPPAAKPAAPPSPGILDKIKGIPNAIANATGKASARIQSAVGVNPPPLPNVPVPAKPAAAEPVSQLNVDNPPGIGVPAVPQPVAAPQAVGPSSAALKPQVDAITSQLNALNAKIKPQMDQLAKYKDQFDHLGQELPTVAPTEHSINEAHNVLVGPNNKLVASVNQDIDAYKSLQAKQQSLVAQYNDALRREAAQLPSGPTQTMTWGSQPGQSVQVPKIQPVQPGDKVSLGEGGPGPLPPVPLPAAPNKLTPASQQTVVQPKGATIPVAAPDLPAQPAGSPYGPVNRVPGPPPLPQNESEASDYLLSKVGLSRKGIVDATADAVKSLATPQNASFAAGLGMLNLVPGVGQLVSAGVLGYTGLKMITDDGVKLEAARQDAQAKGDQAAQSGDQASAQKFYDQAKYFNAMKYFTTAGAVLAGEGMKGELTGAAKVGQGILDARQAAAKTSAYGDLVDAVADTLHQANPQHGPQSASDYAAKAVADEIKARGGYDQVDTQTLRDLATKAKAYSEIKPSEFVDESTPAGPPQIPVTQAEVLSSEKVTPQNSTIEEQPPQPFEPTFDEDGKKVDRIRGSIDLPLVPEATAPDGPVTKVGEAFGKKSKPDSIMAADLQRTQQTAKAISDATGVPVQTNPAIRDIAYGALEGKPSADVIHEINDKIVNHPDVAFADQSPSSTTPGESFNQYKARMLPVVQGEMKKLETNPDYVSVMVVNRRSIKTIDGMLHQGSPYDQETDAKRVTQFGDDTHPGDVYRLRKTEDGEWKIENADGLKDFKKLPGGIYLVRHGETAYNGAHQPIKEAVQSGPAEVPKPVSGPIHPEVLPPPDTAEGLGPRWMMNRDLGASGEGESQYWLDGTDEENANAGIEAANGKYRVQFKDGRQSRWFDTIQEAGKAAEKVIPQRVAGKKPGPLPPVPNIAGKEPTPEFTHDGQKVIGTYQGKAVLANGKQADVAPHYVATLNEKGIPELTDQQVAKLGPQALPKPPNATAISYDDAQKQIDAFEDLLEKKYGAAAVATAPTHPEVYGNLPLPPSPIPQPELAHLQQLYKLRDGIDQSQVEANVAEIDKKFEQLIPDKEARRKLVRELAQADLPTALRSENQSGEKWRDIGKAVNKIAHYISENVTGDIHQTAFHIDSVIAGTAEAPKVELEITSERGLGPSQETLNETQRWLDHLSPESTIKVPGAGQTTSAPESRIPVAGPSTKALPKPPVQYTYRPLDVDNAAGTVLYHGTKAPIKALTEADPAQFAQTKALYGHGLYMTDNPAVAEGYAKTKGPGASGKVLSAKLGDVKLLDLEKPFPPEVQKVFDQIEVSYGDGPSDRSGQTGKEVFSKLKMDMQDAGLPTSEATEIYQNMEASLQQLGYDGFRHEGGSEKSGHHNVVILFPDYGDAAGRRLHSLITDQSTKGLPDVPKINQTGNAGTIEASDSAGLRELPRGPESDTVNTEVDSGRGSGPRKNLQDGNSGETRFNAVTGPGSGVRSSQAAANLGIPGLEVRSIPGKPSEFHLIHTTSGRQVGDSGSLSKVTAMAQRLAKLGDWERSAEDIESDPVFKAAINKALTGEKGAINFWHKKPLEGPRFKPSDPRTAQLLKKQDPIPNIWNYLRTAPARFYRNVRANSYNRDIEMWPQFAEQVRRAQEIPVDAHGRAINEIKGIAKGTNPTQFKNMEDVWVLEDQYETAKRLGPEHTPLNIESEVLEKEINAGMATLDDSGKAALSRAHDLMMQIWNDLVERGEANPKDPQDVKQKYFPNMIIHDYGNALYDLPGLPMRMQMPIRTYLQERKGHADPHDNDIIRVLEKYLTRVHAHNGYTDFLKKAAEENDVLRKMTPEQLESASAQTHGLKPGAVFTLEDPSNLPQARGRTEKTPPQVYKIYQTDPGRVFFPILGMRDKEFRDAALAGFGELDIDLTPILNAIQNKLPNPDLIELGTGKQLTDKVLALGGYKKRYALPIEIANKLEHFKDSDKIGGWETLTRAATNLQKAVNINSNIISFMRTVGIGGAFNLYRTDTKAFRNLPTAALALAPHFAQTMVDELMDFIGQPELVKTVTGYLKPAQRQELLDLMQAARIFNSSFYGGGVPRAVNVPELRQYSRQSIPQKISGPIGDLLRAWKRGIGYAHILPEIAQFMENAKRFREGKPLVTGHVNPAGMTPEMVMGKLAREVNPDFGARSMTPEARWFRILFMFASFHLMIVAPWLKYMTRKGMVAPGDEFLLKYVLPFIVLPWVWNHYVYPDVEDQLEPWQRETTHINTGFKDKTGKPEIIDAETPLDMAARWFGLQTLQENIEKVRQNKMTLEEAAWQQVKDLVGPQQGNNLTDLPVVGSAPALEMWSLFNPTLRAITDIIANKDTLSGRRIVPDGINGTKTAEKLQAAYLLEKTISPLMQMNRAEQMDDPGTGLKDWLFSTGPFGVLKALGIQSVDGDAAKIRDYNNLKSTMITAQKEDIYKITNAMIEQASGNINAEQAKEVITAAQNAWGPYPLMTSEEYQAIRTNPAFNLSVVEELLRKTSDPTARQNLLNQKAMLQRELHLKTFEDLNKQVLQPRIGLPPDYNSSIPRPWDVPAPVAPPPQ